MDPDARELSERFFRQKVGLDAVAVFTRHGTRREDGPWSPARLARGLIHVVTHSRVDAESWERLAREADIVGCPLPSRPQWEAAHMEDEDFHAPSLSALAQNTRLWIQAWRDARVRLVWKEPEYLTLRRVGQHVLQAIPDGTLHMIT